MRSRLYFSLVPLMGLARGLYISDDLIRNPFRPLPLPPEIVLQTSLNIEIRQNKDTVLATKPTITLPVAPTTIPLFPPYPAPIPMDLQLSYALTTPCLSYLTTLLSTDTFLSCLPFSLLLTTSTGYAAMLTTAATTGNYTTLNTLMAYVTSPQPSSAECDAFMSAAYAKMGEKSSGCTADLSKRSAAADARVGLGSAGLMRKAAGLRNPGSGKWCYLEALASDRPDDLYLWSLPAGIASSLSLPASTRPTCSKCSALLLNQYTTSTPSTPSMNITLVNSAVKLVNGACGQDFAQYSVTSTSTATPVITKLRRLGASVVMAISLLLIL